MSKLTGTHSEVAAYECRLNSPINQANIPVTTLTTVPGVLQYRGAKIQVSLACFCPANMRQILDLPGIIEGAKDGKVT